MLHNKKAEDQVRKIHRMFIKQVISVDGICLQNTYYMTMYAKLHVIQVHTSISARLFLQIPLSGVPDFFSMIYLVTSCVHGICMYGSMYLSSFFFCSSRSVTIVV